jgi:hypothetical protein
MIRNLKTMGIALAALVALSALAASVASAQEQGTLTSTGPVTLTGEERPGSPLLANAITGSFGSYTCDGSTYTGHKVLTHAETTAGTKHSLIPVPATKITITPHYATKCFAHIPVLGTRPMTVTMNGCDYDYTLGQTTGGEHTYGVTVDITCPPGKQIETHIYKNGSVTHPDADAICTVKIGEANNQDMAGLHVKTTTSPTIDDLHLEGMLENIHTENSGTQCGSGTSETADCHHDVTIKGHNAEGAATGITITHP